MAKRLVKPTIDEILRTNKGVDPKELKAIEKVREAARRYGRQRPGYDLAMPFDRHRVTVGSNPDSDPRRVKLRPSNPAAQ